MKADFKRHNEEVRLVWEAYHARQPIRVPMILGLSSRNYLLNEEINTEGITYKDYFDSPEVMLDVQVRFVDYIRHHIPHDIEMGIPEEGWMVSVDFQNCYDAAWFGCDIVFPENQCPDTRPQLTDDNRKRAILDKEPPEPFDNLMARVREFYEFFQSQKGVYFHRGKSIHRVLCDFPTSTDGPFTLACQLCGTEKLCIDMVTDPDYAHRLMDYLTTALIVRMAAWREYLGLPPKGDTFFMADDYIQLISTRSYCDFVLPYHKRIYQAFSGSKDNSIHLCGDATRHFPIIHAELGVDHFDTGFPVDFKWLRNVLGPDVEISGGPHVELLRIGTPEKIREEVMTILQSGVIQGGRFILREGNNLAPKTPIENIESMYQTCRTHGIYSL